MNILQILPFARLRGEQTHITESYVSSPPAALIVDERGNVFILGLRTAQKGDSPNREFAFNVLCNGIETGCIASRIERRNGRIRAFTRSGWLHWNGRSFI